MSKQLPQHATLGASSAHRWRNCAGAPRMEAKVPSSPSGAAAMAGTAAHEIAALLLTGKLEDDALPHISTWQGDDLDEPVEIDETMRERIRVYVDACRGLEAEAPATSVAHVETHFNLDPLNPPAPMYGTCDHAIVDVAGRHLDVNDFKSGYIEVDPIKNDQLMFYALGAVVSVWPEGEAPPETITVRIIQPAHDPAVKPWTFSWQEMVEFKRDLFADAEATLDPDAPLTPGEKQCRWCDAKAICPALREYANKVAGDEFMSLPVVATYDELEPETADSSPNLPTPDDLTLEQMTDIMEKGALLRDWLDAIEEHVHNRVLAGEQVPGMKIVQKTTHRKWSDDELIEQWFRKKRVRVGDFTKTKLVSPAQAERMLRDYDLAIPEGLVQRPEGAYIVVSDDDPRTAITQGEEFMALPAPQDMEEAK